MAEEERASNQQISQDFLEMIGNLAVADPDFIEKVIAIRPTIEQQREHVTSIRAKHYGQWQEAGITGVVADRIMHAKDGDGFLGGADLRFQRNKNKRTDGSETEEWKLILDRSTTEVSEDGKSTKVHSNIGVIPFARIEAGQYIPEAGFTDDQVRVMTNQVTELESLREDDLGLPNLDWNLHTISDPSTGLVAKRPPTQQ